VIIDKSGIASRYPKPLTISAHTLRAVPQNSLKTHQRLSLSWQSRLHSRGGRSVGKKLGSVNLPIMSMNSIVQAIVPPPKYRVTDLVPCTVGTRVRMENLYVIERGLPELIERVPHSTAVDELLENTEDAYGFPPYSSLAPHLSIDGKNYKELRAEERDVLASALSGVDVHRIRVADYSWPSLITSRPAALDGVEERHAELPRQSVEWVGAGAVAGGS